MKNRLLALLLIGCMTFSLTACGGEEKSSSKKKKAEVTEEEDEEETGDEESADDAPQETEESEAPAGDGGIVEVSLSSDKEILSWIAGEWKMVDPWSGDDYVKVEIGQDGSCKWTRLYDQAVCSGDISFDKVYPVGETPDECVLNFKDFKDWMPQADADGYYMDFSTSGIFHLGSGADRDYMYLSEIGNGDTWASIYLLNPNASGNYEMEEMTWNPQWLFYRENEGHGERQPETDATFYAWVWEKDPAGSLLLQKMQLYTWDDMEEYTDRAYEAGCFGELEDIGITHYEVQTGVDLSRIEDRFREDSGYPLEIYEFKTDAEGKICELSRVNQSYNNIYDLGNREPEYSVNETGTAFTYNGVTFELQDFAGAAVNAIMDCTKVGNDWIILDCHINPNIGAYEFFYIPYGNFAFELYGANLTWQGTDLSTAVYSAYTEVYDFWGNMIYSDPTAEIYGLAFTDENTLSVDTWHIEGEEEKFETVEVEYEQVDRPMFQYLCYLISRRDREWQAFLEEAPEGAVSFIMINPPEVVETYLLESVQEPAEGLDELAVVFFKDGDKIHIEALEPDTTGRVASGDYYMRGRGNAVVFSVTVPEGMATQVLDITTDDNKKDVRWPIETITGRTPQRSTFIVEE